MNFFQFAQSSKSKPSSNAFAPSPPSFIQFPTVTQEEKNLNQERKNENNDQNIGFDSNSNSSLDQISRSPFIFNPKKVTFASTEMNKPDEPSNILSSTLLSQSQPDAPIVHSENVTNLREGKKNNDEAQIVEINNSEEEVTNENFEEQMARLESDFKLITSWSQKQISVLQQLQEEINISILEGNELLAKLNSILNS